LDGVSLDVRRGEVHAVIGENGAGKSTLAKVIAGVEPFNSGEMRLLGEYYRPSSPCESMARGVGMVHQHFQLFDSLTVTQNVVLGHEPVRTTGRLDENAARQRVAELSESYGLPIDPHKPVGELPVSERQTVEILKVLHKEASLVILDEPTSVLGPSAAQALLDAVKRLRENSHTVILIAHKISEVLSVADRITVLREGRGVRTVEGNGTTQDDLLQMMTGGRQDLLTTNQEVIGSDQEATVLKLVGFRVAGAGASTLGPIDLTVAAGEVVGVLTPPESGQRLLELALAGVVPAATGRVLIDDRDVTHLSPYERRKRGAAFIPSERMRRGVASGASVHDNATALVYRSADRRELPKGSAKGNPLSSFTSDILKRFKLRSQGPDSLVANLSGGNVQRLLLGRELVSAEQFSDGSAPRLVVSANPTQGLDVGGVRFVHDLLRHYRDRGSAILLLTNDMGELLALSSRVAVLNAGKLSRFVPNDSSLGEERVEALPGESGSAKASSSGTPA